MTTEDDFQAALDADPRDFHTRLVFADWLQERDDRRAEGYRALGVIRRRPCYMEGDPATTHVWWANRAVYDSHNALPRDWWELLVELHKTDEPIPQYCSIWPIIDGAKRVWNRRDCEDAAALAFARLPAARRAQLLATESAGVA